MGGRLARTGRVHAAQEWELIKALVLRKGRSNKPNAGLAAPEPVPCVGRWESQSGVVDFQRARQAILHLHASAAQSTTLFFHAAYWCRERGS